MRYRGVCHCGAVSFAVDLPEHLDCKLCNCSICTKTGHLHYIVPAAKLTDVSGTENLTTYTFNTGVAQHYFCTTCGVRPYYVPRSNPDGYDINVRCLEPQPASTTVSEFDGRNWEQHAHTLAHLSKE